MDFQESQLSAIVLAAVCGVFTKVRLRQKRDAGQRWTQL